MELPRRQTLEKTNRRPAITPLGGATLLLLVTFVLAGAPGSARPTMIAAGDQPRIVETKQARVQPGGGVRARDEEGSLQNTGSKFSTAALPAAAAAALATGGGERLIGRETESGTIVPLRSELLDLPPPTC